MFVGVLFCHAWSASASAAAARPDMASDGGRAGEEVQQASKDFVYLIQVQQTSEALMWLQNRSTQTSDVMVIVKNNVNLAPKR